MIINSAGRGYEHAISRAKAQIEATYQNNGKEVEVQSIDLDLQKISGSDINDLSCGYWLLDFLQKIISNIEMIKEAVDFYESVESIIKQEIDRSNPRSYISEKAAKFNEDAYAYFLIKLLQNLLEVQWIILICLLY